MKTDACLMIITNPCCSVNNRQQGTWVKWKQKVFPFHTTLEFLLLPMRNSVMKLRPEAILYILKTKNKQEKKTGSSLLRALEGCRTLIATPVFISQFSRATGTMLSQQALWWPPHILEWLKPTNGKNKLSGAASPLCTFD